MSSRQEEKERRRREREALEQSERQAAERRKRLGIAGIALAALAVIAVIAVVVAGAGGDDEGGSGVKGEVGKPPAVKIENLQEAAKAAGCKVNRYPDYGSSHTGEAVKYKTNPPTSGDHDPTAAPRGEYEAGNPPDVEQSVHALEHGRINVQYKPGTPANRIEQLRGLVEEEVKGSSGYKTLLFQNQTGMTAAVAATAWRNSLTCPQWNDQVFDAIRAFREDFVDKGPEFLPDDGAMG